MLRTHFQVLMGLSLAALLPGAATSGSSSGLLVVANKAEHTLGIVDPATGKQLATVAEGGVTGHEVIVSPDGKTAYVPIYGDSGVGKAGTDGRNMVAIDIMSRKIVGNLDFGHAVRPHCPVFGPHNGSLYVTTELDKTVSIIDPATLKVVGTIPTGQPESHMLAISHDGKRGYTANVGPGTVSVLDLDARKTLAVIPISKQTQRISISPDDSMVFTSDQTKPQLAVIDTATNKVKTWVELPGPGYGSSVAQSGDWLVIAIQKTKQVAVVNLHTMKVDHTIDVPAVPQETLVGPGDKVAYVSCDSSNQVAAIDTSTWKVIKLIDVGKGADGLAWASVR
jgi:YVTN family beta-propeller protein